VGQYRQLLFDSEKTNDLKATFVRGEQVLVRRFFRGVRAVGLVVIPTMMMTMIKVLLPTTMMTTTLIAGVTPITVQVTANKQIRVQSSNPSGWRWFRWVQSKGKLRAARGSPQRNLCAIEFFIDQGHNTNRKYLIDKEFNCCGFSTRHWPTPLTMSLSMQRRCVAPEF
jgi:hypothetical protein